ncbi:MAG: hypothetical protein DME32_16900 [Verrucomicrobia bacterium]|nr:MAG: hypothetical protein DME32_16900 [Verrucomicrobiota bacterium]
MTKSGNYGKTAAGVVSSFVICWWVIVATANGQDARWFNRVRAGLALDAYATSDNHCVNWALE